MRSKDGSYAFPFAKIRPMQNIDIQQASGTASKKKGGGGVRAVASSMYIQFSLNCYPI